MALEIKPTLTLTGEDSEAILREIEENDKGKNKVDFSIEIEWANDILAKLK